MKYEFLNHTADAKFRAYGDNLEKAFENAALAMFSILIAPEKVNSKIQKTINISSKSKSSLLYDFLEELLFLLDVDSLVLHSISSLKIIENNDYFELSCVFNGDIAKNYVDICGNIKSITYNDMLIDEDFSKEEKKVMLQIVVDL